jgi:hypothetical protein
VVIVIGVLIGRVFKLSQPVIMTISMVPMFLLMWKVLAPKSRFSVWALAAAIGAAVAWVVVVAFPLRLDPLQGAGLRVERRGRKLRGFCYLGRDFRRNRTKTVTPERNVNESLSRIATGKCDSLKRTCEPAEPLNGSRFCFLEPKAWPFLFSRSLDKTHRR